MFTKSQFIEELCAKLPEEFKTKASAERAFDAFCATLAQGIVAEGGVRLPNVGSFNVKVRPSRTGRNPQSGKALLIPEKNVVKFSTSKSLDETLNR